MAHKYHLMMDALIHVMAEESKQVQNLIIIGCVVNKCVYWLE